MSAWHNVGLAHEPMFSKLLRILPTDSPGEEVDPIHVPTFTDADIEEVDRLAAAYQEAGITLQAYLIDLRKELQGLLLGKLFPGATIEQRVPADPRYRAISLEPSKVKELGEYFENETPWGKQGKEAQTRTEPDT